MLRPLRFRDQLVDRLSCKDLPGQRARSCLQRIGAGRFRLHSAVSETSSPSKAATATKSDDLAEEISYRLLWPRAAFLTFCLFSPRAPVRGPFGADALRAARFTFLRSCVSVMLLRSEEHTS